jgi:hypothetical protein
MAASGVLMARSRRLLRNQPPADISMESNAKNVALVPTTRFASRRLPAPICWPTRMVADIERPNTPPNRRNITLLALEVAASDASPRNRPTQTVLTEPFSVCRTFPNRIGSAKKMRPRLRDPSVREPDACMGASELTGSVMLVKPIGESLERGCVEVHPQFTLADALERTL